MCVCVCVCLSWVPFSPSSAECINILMKFVTLIISSTWHWRHFQGHGFKGQRQTVMALEILWTRKLLNTEGIWTKTHIDISHSIQATNGLGFTGHGFKLQRSRTQKRFPAKAYQSTDTIWCDKTHHHTQPLVFTDDGYYYRFATHTGATTAEKLRGTKVGVPTPGPRVRPKDGLGVGCGRESPPPAVRVPGYHPRKIFYNSDAKSCILVTTCCEIACFLKTTTKKLGDQYAVGPTSLPRSLQLLHLWLHILY